MSQQKLAELVGISLPHVSAIEHGKKSMRVLTFIRIIEALQVSADSILRADVPSVNHLCQNEFGEILKDCSPSEIESLRQILLQVKETMRSAPARE